MEKLQQMASDFWIWLQVQVLIPDALVQIVLVIGFAVIAHFAAKLINRKITAISQRGKLLSKIEDFIDPLYFPAVLLIFFIIAQVAGRLLGYPVEVLIIAGNLATAWIVIRLLTRFITNQQLARTVALLIWVIAALNIFNLLEPLIQILESAAIQIGDTTVSAYNIIWGLLTLIFFIWVAVALSNLVNALLAGDLLDDAMPLLNEFGHIAHDNAYRSLAIEADAQRAVFLGRKGSPLQAAQMLEALLHASSEPPPQLRRLLLRSLYETYKASAQYRQALASLEELVALDRQIARDNLVLQTEVILIRDQVEQA
ncbi:MAG: hypothetical protein IH995_00875, partial [Proteobacteria bacterium]|nr:hypothetical protein [Pseudomonadota bacterium]